MSLRTREHSLAGGGGIYSVKCALLTLKCPKMPSPAGLFPVQQKTLWCFPKLYSKYPWVWRERKGDKKRYRYRVRGEGRLDAGGFHAPPHILAFTVNMKCCTNNTIKGIHVTFQSH